MRSTFVTLAIMLALVLIWYSDLPVELGLRSGGHSVPETALIVIVTVFVVLMRRRPAMRTVAH